MSKKNLNISKIKEPQVKNDGMAVSFEVLSANNQAVTLTVPTEKLNGLVEGLALMHMSAEVRKALPKTYRSITEFSPMPTPFPVSDVNIASFIETGGISVEVKDLQGHSVHLHFKPEHFQFFVNVVEKINALPQGAGTH